MNYHYRDFDQELLSFDDIHNQIDSKIGNRYKNWFANWFKNVSLVKIWMLIAQLCKAYPFISNKT